MKNLVAIFALIVATAFGVSAQTATTSQTANEGVIAVTYVRENVDVSRVDGSVFHYDADKDSVGLNAGYTRYLGGDADKAGVIGLTGDLGLQFRDGGVGLTTVTGGATLKARNSKFVQPYVRGLAGVGRQSLDLGGIRNNASDWSRVFVAGAGVDFNLKKFSRYKLGFGADYVNTGFFGEVQHNARLSARLVF